MCVCIFCSYVHITVTYLTVYCGIAPHSLSTARPYSISCQLNHTNTNMSINFHTIPSSLLMSLSRVCPTIVFSFGIVLSSACCMMYILSFGTN